MTKQARDAVAAMPRNAHPTLDEIMLRHGSDKASAASQGWQWPMDYCRRVYKPWRRCRECHRDRQSAYRQRVKSVVR